MSGKESNDHENIASAERRKDSSSQIPAESEEIKIPVYLTSKLRSQSERRVAPRRKTALLGDIDDDVSNTPSASAPSLAHNNNNIISLNTGNHMGENCNAQQSQLRDSSSDRTLQSQTPHNSSVTTPSPSSAASSPSSSSSSSSSSSVRPLSHAAASPLALSPIVTSDHSEKKKEKGKERPNSAEDEDEKQGKKPHKKSSSRTSSIDTSEHKSKKDSPSLSPSSVSSSCSSISSSLTLTPQTCETSKSSSDTIPTFQFPHQSPPVGPCAETMESPMLTPSAGLTASQLSALTSEQAQKEKDKAAKKLLKKALKSAGKDEKSRWQQRDLSIGKLRESIAKLESRVQIIAERRESLRTMLLEAENEYKEYNGQLQQQQQEFRSLVISRDAERQAMSGKDESKFSYFSSIMELEPICNTLPKQFRLVPPTGLGRCCFITSPRLPTDKDDFGPLGVVLPSEAKETDALSYYDMLSARTISTYPLMPGTRIQQGSPVCDIYAAELTEGRAILCLADGCSWGEKPREAARRASACFVNHVSENHTKKKTIRELGVLLLEGLAKAHSAIVAQKEDPYDAGTTTLVGGVVCGVTDSKGASLRRLESGLSLSAAKAQPLKGTFSTSKMDEYNPFLEGIELWAFLFISVGDCKVFRYSSSSGKISDITRGNRGTDATDPGGRIGPHLDFGMPDLRNLSLHCQPCNQNDLIIMVSDGVYDNLDPVMLGMSPGEISPEFSGVSWDALFERDSNQAERLKELFMCTRMEDIIFGRYTVQNSPGMIPKRMSCSIRSEPCGGILHRTEKNPPKLLDPNAVCTALESYCETLTLPSKEFMENNLTQKLTNDYKKYPGKLDHTTCVVFRVDLPAAL
eukprot:TRINITY_DN1657_c0_g1_i2.p1 TRINITY_DN1657_c0_g1~~TRINITY_DN1657_c0_g1_i2.p1  ORF type:complete len:868 (+),score=233.96 TRINITY_DN1657_c0_g1_i2:30-2606(+)